MSISASDVAKLRSQTGAGMMDCKVALEETGGDMEKAADILRKKGIVKAAKRADKIASEGLTFVKTSGNVGVVAELNSETDFVAKNEDFKNMCSIVVDALLANKSTSLDVALTQNTSDGISIQDYINNFVAKIGEKISLRRFEIVEKSESEIFGAYIHMGGKISILAVFSGGDESLAKDVAMQIAAANPKYIDRATVSTEEMDKEKEIYAAQLRQQGKPENIIENILKGKMEKYYEEVCLVDQLFVKDDSKKIKDILGSVHVIKFIRYELGDGLEKKTNDFAAEVESQINK